MSIVARDRVFHKSHKIYLNDTGFANLDNQYIQFIDFFSTEKLTGLAASRKGGRIIINISAESRYVLYINGKHAGHGINVSTDENCYYDSLDITDFILPNSQNKLAVLLYYSKENSITHIHSPGIIFEVKYYAPNERTGSVLLASAPETQSRIAAEYSIGDISKVSESGEYTFEYDSTVYDNWETPEYVISQNNRSRISWQNSSIYDTVCKYLPNSIKQSITMSPQPAKILAQGLFDYGNEYRQSHKKTPAAYMQNAAMISKSFDQLCSTTTTRFLNTEDSSKVSFSYSFSDKGETQNTPLVLFGKGLYVIFDLLQEECGHLFFDIEAPGGTVINISYGNDLDDLRIRSCVNNKNYSCSYICNGERSFFAHFAHKIHGRYLQFFVESEYITFHACGILPESYPFSTKETATFNFSDALHNKIYSKGITVFNQLALKMAEENFLNYTGKQLINLKNFLLCNYYFTSDFIFAENIITRISDDIKNHFSVSDGKAEFICQNSSKYDKLLYWVQFFADHLLYSGNTDFAISQLPVAVSIVNFFLEKCKDDFAIKLYSEMHCNEEESAVYLDAELTALVIIATEKLAQTFAFISANQGISSRDQNTYIYNANQYMNYCEILRSGFHKVFYDEEKELYASKIIDNIKQDHNKHINSLSIYCGATSNYSALQNKIAEFLSCEKFLTPDLYLYEALLLCDNKYINYIMENIENYCGNSLFSVPSYEFLKTKSTASDHSFLTPLLVYFKYILGLRPTRPGFAEYQCQPRQYKTHIAEGTINTPAGQFSITTSKDHYNCKKVTP